jgi:hypothetical protein
MEDCSIVEWNKELSVTWTSTVVVGVNACQDRLSKCASWLRKYVETNATEVNCEVDS